MKNVIGGKKNPSRWVQNARRRGREGEAKINDRMTAENRGIVFETGGGLNLNLKSEVYGLDEILQMQISTPRSKPPKVSIDTNNELTNPRHSLLLGLQF